VCAARGFGAPAALLRIQDALRVYFALELGEQPGLAAWACGTRVFLGPSGVRGNAGTQGALLWREHDELRMGTKFNSD
jgi:hypothetical protein